MRSSGASRARRSLHSRAVEGTRTTPPSSPARSSGRSARRSRSSPCASTNVEPAPLTRAVHLRHAMDRCFLGKLGPISTAWRACSPRRMERRSRLRPIRAMRSRERPRAGYGRRARQRPCFSPLGRGSLFGLGTTRHRAALTAPDPALMTKPVRLDKPEVAAQEQIAAASRAGDDGDDRRRQAGAKRAEPRRRRTGERLVGGAIPTSGPARSRRATTASPPATAPSPPANSLGAICRISTAIAASCACRRAMLDGALADLNEAARDRLHQFLCLLEPGRRLCGQRRLRQRADGLQHGARPQSRHDIEGQDRGGLEAVTGANAPPVSRPPIRRSSAIRRLSGDTMREAPRPPRATRPTPCRHPPR